MSHAHVKFAAGVATSFDDDLKSRVDAHFAARGRSSKATPGMVLRTVLLLGTFYGAYALLLTNRLTPLAMLGVAVGMGVVMAGIGFGVAHDALHGAYSRRPWVNRLLGYSFDLLGANSYLWKITHNVIHHTYTNIQGVDEDLEVSPLIRLSPHSPHRPVQRYQHLYAWVLYSFSTLFWVFVKDYKYFLQRDLGPYRDKRHPRSEIAILAATKAVYYGYTIVIPLLVLHVTWWQFLIGYFAMHLTAGLILGVVFQLAHVVDGPAHPVPANGVVANAWAAHQLATSCDFAPGNRLLSWYVGGLNFQVEHHLLPKVCSAHYPALFPIVRDAAARHGLPHHCHPSLVAAVRSHYRTLKAFGRPAVAAV